MILDITKNKAFTTSQVAKMLSVHPNTVRWYEAEGFISPVPRLKNGYRCFTNRHILQLQVCRLIYGGGFANPKIREASNEILFLLSEWKINNSLKQAKYYLSLIETEYNKALETTAILVNWVSHDINKSPGKTYTRKEAANLLDITTEVLRNWERNGLINVTRSGKKNEKVYNENVIDRLRVIYMLRQNNHSIAAIKQSLSCFDSGNSTGAALALNQPITDSERVYMVAGDHWLEVLWDLSIRAKNIIDIIERIKK